MSLDRGNYDVVDELEGVGYLKNVFVERRKLSSGRTYDNGERIAIKSLLI